MFFFSSFKPKKLTQNPKLISQIVKEFWLIWGFIVKGLVSQWRLWTMSFLSSNILALLHFSLFHWVLSPSVYVTFLTFLWVLSLSLSRSTSLLLYLKKQRQNRRDLFPYIRNFIILAIESPSRSAKKLGREHRFIVKGLVRKN